ncbi:hypothetical protein BHE74_00026351 [Ensete ventricosum]|nr:hypothetical protein BHE74_00026351 [Ensete ventricosum]RZR90112.1 hypothetical protein BHM03_00017936 [Ensete ventricosum]
MFPSPNEGSASEGRRAPPKVGCVAGGTSSPGGTLTTLLLAPNVVGAPSRPGSPHNGVQATSTRGAQCRKFEVGMCGCSSCDFDADPSNLAELFLQDKTFSRVLGSQGRLSYKHLPSHLKQCFVFCSVFHKDFVFDKDRLVRSRYQFMPNCSTYSSSNRIF